MRGDVPAELDKQDVMDEFSPRARGCSAATGRPYSIETVFPACAGMFLAKKLRRAGIQGFPRVRGDVPAVVQTGTWPAPFSPRARGCSPADTVSKPADAVFPACAGMFLLIHTIGHGADSFPRVRGDVPPRSTRAVSRSSFSPRARGCSPVG